MSTEINLLPHKQKRRFSEEQILLYTKVLAITMLILVVTSSIALFLLNRDPTLVRIKAEENSTLAQLTLLHSKTAKNLIVLDRTKRLQDIVKQRGTLDKTIASFEDLLPPEVAVTQYALDKSTFSMTVSASSLIPIGSLLDKLTNLINQKSLLKKLTIEGLVTDEKGGKYLLSVSGTFL